MQRGEGGYKVGRVSEVLKESKGEVLKNRREKILREKGKVLRNKKGRKRRKGWKRGS